MDENNEDVQRLHYEIPFIMQGNYVARNLQNKPFFYSEKIMSPTSGIEQLHYVIPPINTDIRFSNYLPKYDLFKYKGSVSLPKNFSWSIITSEDSVEIIKRKRLINPVTNQGLCGYCWSISTVTTLGDNFVCKGLVDWVPYISATYALACYPQDQCNGGNNAKLCLDITNSGITSVTCLDSSFCKANGKCFKKPSDPNIISLSMEELNKGIPTCGCYYQGEFYFYFIQSAEVISVPKDDLINTTADIVKDFIFKNGPVIGGFLVFNNFRLGHFTKVNGGVYFENGVYSDNNGNPVEEGQFRFDEEQTSAANYIGTHAVSIVGWGIAPNILTDSKGTKKDVPYWLVRNSWSNSWGDNGYFKIAMYPYNKIAQLDKQITIIDSAILSSNETIVGGGIIFMNVSDPPTKKYVQQSQDTKGVTKSFPDQFYQDTNDNTKVFPFALKEEYSSSKPFFSILKFMLIIFCMLMFLILVYSFHSI